MLKLYSTQHTRDADEQQGMEHLRQQLFQLGTVCLQLCNLMAQTTHCLHTINSSGHLSYLLHQAAAVDILCTSMRIRNAVCSPSSDSCGSTT